MKSFSANIDIDATPAAVWAVLIDTGNWPDLRSLQRADRRPGGPREDTYRLQHAGAWPRLSGESHHFRTAAADGLDGQYAAGHAQKCTHPHHQPPWCRQPLRDHRGYIWAYRPDTLGWAIEMAC